MASGFLTNDGKDLDSRYLGINAKAVSAKTADTATKATTATTATNVTNKGAISRNGNAVQVRFSGAPHVPYTVPTAGLLVSTSGFGLAAGIGVRSSSVFVNKGDKVYTGTASVGDEITAYIVPLKIS